VTVREVRAATDEEIEEAARALDEATGVDRPPPAPSAPNLVQLRSKKSRRK
jgi:hypothetical protein